jgi:hypothetical protein
MLEVIRAVKAVSTEEKELTIGAMKQFLAVVIWILIWLPTSLFVVAVMFKSVFATGRGKVVGAAALVAVVALIQLVRSTTGNGRNAE